LVTRLSVNSTERKQPETYLQKLVDYLIAGVDDPLVKLKIIHDWIADNIIYHYDAYLAGTFGELCSTEPYQILKDKLTVCGGFSSLYFEMCTLAGVPVEVVSGRLKVFEALAPKKNLTRKPLMGILYPGLPVHILRRELN